jgi:hypothetical protein
LFSLNDVFKGLLLGVNMKNNKSCYNFLLALIIFSYPALAHHSDAEYQNNGTIEMEAVVDVIVWRNPHIELRFIRTSGEQESWRGEAANLTMMNSLGISRDVLQQGMTIRVAGLPSSRRPNAMWVTNILLPDGREMLLLPNVAALWAPGNTFGLDLNHLQATGSIPDDGKGMFRIWTWNPEPFWMIHEPDFYPLTEEAQLIAESWDIFDPQQNQIVQCIPPGMPATMGSPHPMELIDNGETITLSNEEMDVVRTIYMNQTAIPTGFEVSALGLSEGRWEGEVLIINTSRLDTPYMNRQGVPLSTQASVEERFEMDAEAGRLDYQLTITDPDYLTEPFVHQLKWNWNENTFMQVYDCNNSPVL